MGPFEKQVESRFGRSFFGRMTEALPMTPGDKRRLMDVVVQVAQQNGVMPEPDEDVTSLLNRVIPAFRKGRHTPEAWKALGGFLTQIRKLGVNWDTSLIPGWLRKPMGLSESDAASWSAEARGGMVFAKMGSVDVGYAVLGSDGQPGQVQWLTNPNDEEKEQARRVIQDWQEFQRPDQHGNVDDDPKLSESVSALLD